MHLPAHFQFWLPSLQARAAEQQARCMMRSYRLMPGIIGILRCALLLADLSAAKMIKGQLDTIESWKYIDRFAFLPMPEKYTGSNAEDLEGMEDKYGSLYFEVWRSRPVRARVHRARTFIARASHLTTLNPELPTTLRAARSSIRLAQILTLGSTTLVREPSARWHGVCLTALARRAAGWKLWEDVYTGPHSCVQRIQKSNRVMKLDLSADSVFVTERRTRVAGGKTQVKGRAYIQASVRGGPTHAISANATSE
jgi:hypothetical protein